MQLPAFYAADVLAFFEGYALEQSLYEAFWEGLCQRLPETSVKVQKSQISFYGRHLFAAVSLPIRRKKDWPAHCLVVTFGLPARLDSPRIAVATEPYPNRWTHHVLLTAPQELDEELWSWIEQAYLFSESKR